MSKVNFFLKNPKSEDETLIFLVYNHQYKRLKYSTEEYILPSSWDSKLQTPIISRKFPHNSEIHRRLEEYKFFITDLVGELKRKKETITPGKLRIELDKKFKDFQIDEASGLKRVDFIDFIENFIKQCEEGKRLTDKGSRYKIWTIKGYRTLQYHLNEFMKENFIKLDFKDITTDFYSDFLGYFNKKNYATNTIGKHIKNIKVMMSASFDEGLHNNLDYKKKTFRIITEETDAIYLTEEELDKIYAVDLTHKKQIHLDKARDLFMVAARTALRFEDLTKLQEHNFFSNEKGFFLRIQTIKTGVNVVVPLKKQVMNIFNKYNGKLPREISNQKMNEYIKEVGKLAKLNNIVSKNITKGGFKVEIVFKKYDLITTHTARRTAATNLYLAGFPAISIMKLTGHKTERAFLKYIRMSEEDNAYKMADNDYFRNDFIDKPVLRVG